MKKTRLLVVRIDSKVFKLLQNIRWGYKAKAVEQSVLKNKKTILKTYGTRKAA